MNDLLEDIVVMESVLIAMTEGASDERRMALGFMKDHIAKKQSIIEEFEKQAVLTE